MHKQAWDSLLMGFNNRPYEFGTTFIEPKSLPTINQALDRGKAMSINTPVVTKPLFVLRSVKRIV